MTASINRDDVHDALIKQGYMTLKSWVEEKGLDYNSVTQVVSGRCKGSRGKSRIILQHLQSLVTESNRPTRAYATPALEH